MKRFSGIAFLVAFVGFGTGLMTWLVSQGPVMVIYQSSRSAIVKVDTPEMQEALERGRIRIETDQPDSQTLFRVTTGNPFRIEGALESDGSISVISSAGVIVGPDAIIRLPDSDTERAISPLIVSPPTPGAVERKAHGNVYALKILEDGTIRATE